MISMNTSYQFSSSDSGLLLNKEGLSIAYLPVANLKPYKNNARTHSKRQIQQIATSIRTFGFTNPVLVDDQNGIVAGHGRVEAARILGLVEVPTVRLSGLSKAQIKAYILADNRLAENAGWDENLLKIEFQELLDLNLDFDISVTGFEIAEIDLLLHSEPEGEQEEPVILDDGPSVTKLGDLWILGTHRVLCGTALEEESYKALMNHQRASVVFTDPPFNVRINGHASGNGSVKHEEFAMASGEMTTEEFIAFLTQSLGLIGKYSIDGSVHFVCIDWRHWGDLLEAGKTVYDSLLNLCVWVKSNSGLGSLYRSQHELIAVWRKSKKQHRNNVRLGAFGRNRSNIWKYPGMNTLSKQNEEGNLLSLHPTVKPVAMVSDALLDCSAPNEIVLDGFLGSGSTLIAAERTKRICHGIELNPKYVDVAIRRWQRMTGQQALHQASGMSFDSIVEEKEGQHA